MASPTAPQDGTGHGTYKKRKFGKYGGRNARNVNMETLQNALDDDAAQVEGLKRDVDAFQKKEFGDSQRYLANLQKTYNTLKAQSQLKEQEHRAVAEELDRLDRLCAAQKGAPEVSPIDDQIKDMEGEIKKLEQKVKDAFVQKDIFTHMIKRLTDDTIEVQREGEEVQQELEKDEAELLQCKLDLQQAKQGFKNEETKFNDLKTKVQERRQMQEARINDIQKLIQERRALVDRQEERNRMRMEIVQNNSGAGQFEETKMKRMTVVRKVYSSMLEKKISVEEDDLGELEATFQQIKMVTGLSDVDEIVHKFLTRSEKTKQLESVAEDIRQRIEVLRKENEKNRQNLETMRAASQNVSGNRQKIFEMEKSNHDLADLKHQCDEAKKRAYRSSVALEELRTAVARFRSKVEGKNFPVPTNAKLAEYLRELDTKLGAKIRAVSDTLTQNHDEIAGSGEGKSEVVPFAKLQSEKLTKMLYNKMMLTAPDQSRRNVRVNARPNMDDLNRRHRRQLLDDYYSDFVEPDSNQPAAPEEEEEAPREDEEGNPVVDRETVKKLANLIVQRDNPTRTRRRKKAGDASPVESR